MRVSEQQKKTPKALAPANLTDLGYLQVYESGQYYRNRYIASNATARINGINADIVKQSQISVSAPDDTVLMNSAMGFLQALYPPVGTALGSQTLRNGRNVTAPMNGYQLIPVDLVASGAGSEDSGWLQSTSNCAQAQISSNEYFTSEDYLSTLDRTREFYTSLEPVVNGTFSPDQLSFKNAYTSKIKKTSLVVLPFRVNTNQILPTYLPLVFDLINVAEIHNATINSSDLLTPETLSQLRTLANAHEWGLAYNASSPTDMRSIAGKTLAAQIVQFLNTTIPNNNGKGKSKIGIQFGAYATFASFFGLANLSLVDEDFMGIVDYASAMTFELFTNSSSTSSTSSLGEKEKEEEDLYIRFLFHNGTSSSTSEPTIYPLFGTQQETLTWKEFTAQMERFAIGTTEEWCLACGNSTGSCAGYSSSSSSSSSGNGNGNGNGLSPAVNGVIGAMVTLAVILGLEALILGLGGLRIVSKKKMNNRTNEMGGGSGNGSDSEVGGNLKSGM